jgi:hypothetical protein
LISSRGFIPISFVFTSDSFIVLLYQHKRDFGELEFGQLALLTLTFRGFVRGSDESEQAILSGTSPIV